MQLEHGLLFIIIGSLAAFFMAFNNGANDVANAFASAVGSKALKMKLAVAIASVVTFSGALLLGGHVAAKLVGGLVPPDKFANPNLYVIAMISVLIASGFFVLISTLTALPVSSSQAIVGSLSGIAITLGGWSAAPWAEMGIIVIGWILSPLLAAILSVLMCMFVEKIIIGQSHHGSVMARVKRWLPIMVSILLSCGIFALFTITELKQAIGIDASNTFVNDLTPEQKNQRELNQLTTIDNQFQEMSAISEQLREKVVAGHEDDLISNDVRDLAARFFDGTKKVEYAMSQLQVLVTGKLPALFYASRWHVAIVSLILLLPFYLMFKRLIKRWLHHAEDSPEGAQHAFKNLQIGTSCYVAFAIGSNDVANSISPVLAIYLVVKSGGIPDIIDAQMPLWILLIGGAGMATGISALGNRVMRTLGESLTKINNARGFCIDFSVATSVVGASAVGLPVSTTHAATGAVVGSGLAQGKGNVSFATLGKIASGWLITIPVSAVVTIIIFEILKRVM